MHFPGIASLQKTISSKRKYVLFLSSLPVTAVSLFSNKKSPGEEERFVFHSVAPNMHTLQFYWKDENGKI